MSTKQYAQYLSEDQQLQKHAKELYKQNATYFTIVCNILKNISNHPNEPKFRRIKLNNPKLSQVLSIRESFLILEFAGFEKKSETIEFPNDASLSKLRNTLVTLEQCIKNQSNPIVDIQLHIQKWQALLYQGDEEIKKGNIKEGLDLYKQSANEIEPLVKSNYKLSFLCAHSYEQIAKAIMNHLHSAENALDYYSKAIDFCTVPAVTPTEYKIVAQSYYGFAQAVGSSGSKDFNSMIKALDYAWKAAHFCDDNNAMKIKISQLYQATYVLMKDNQNAAYWGNIYRNLTQHDPRYNMHQLASRLIEIESSFNESNAKESIEKLKQLINDAEGMEDFCASIYGQIIYHHRMCKSLNLADGIQYGMKALEILVPKYGERHDVIRNVYLSLADTYRRLGDLQKANFYENKMHYSQMLLENAHE